MAKRQRHTPEQIISELREAEVKLAKGTAIAQVCKDLAVTEQTYYRWLKQLEGGNARPKRLLADAELDKAILREDPAVQAEVADRAVAEGMNRAEVVRTVRARSTGKPKSRGGKNRKVTERTFRTSTGTKIVAKNSRGLDHELILAALREAVDQILAARDEAAA